MSGLWGRLFVFDGWMHTSVYHRVALRVKRLETQRNPERHQKEVERASNAHAVDVRQADFALSHLKPSDGTWIPCEAGCVYWKPRCDGPSTTHLSAWIEYAVDAISGT
jgi:hypothetical protein